MEKPTESQRKQNFNQLDDDEKSCGLLQRSSIDCAMVEIQKSSLLKPSSYLYTVNCGKENLCSIDINSRNNLLACGFENSEIHVFNLKILKSKQIKEGCSQDLDYVSEPLSIAENDGNDPLLKSDKVLKGHQGSVYSLAFSSPHSLLLSCSEDSSVRAWSTEDFSTKAVYSDQNYPILNVTLSSNGAYFATASMDFCARLWSFERSQPLRYFVDHSTSVDNVKFHSNSKYIATTSDKTIQLWAVEDGRSVRSFLGHQSYISCIAFSPNGQHLASADENGYIKIWDLGSGKEIGEIKGHTGEILSITYSKNNAFIASGGFDKVLKVWDVKHCVDNKSSSNTINLCNKEMSRATEHVDCHPTESTLHYVSFRKKDLLLSVAGSGNNC